MATVSIRHMYTVYHTSFCKSNTILRKIQKLFRSKVLNDGSQIMNHLPLWWLQQGWRPFMDLPL